MCNSIKKAWLLLCGLSLTIPLYGGTVLEKKWAYTEKGGTVLRQQTGAELKLSPRSSGWRADQPGWQALNAEPLCAGSVYVMYFSAKASEAADGKTAAFKVIVNEAGTDRRSAPFRCGPVVIDRWQNYSVPFLMTNDLPPGRAEIVLVHGWGDGQIEVRDFRVEMLSKDPAVLRTFRREGLWYEGQDPGASWRAEAEACIEKHRKGDFTIRVTDAQGVPVAGARVVIEQTAHAYRFGVAVNSALLPWLDVAVTNNAGQMNLFSWYRESSGRTGLNAEMRVKEATRYFEVLTNNFNYAVLENGMKWQAWAGEWGEFNREQTLQTVDWLNERGLEVKGHVLVWPGWENSPAAIVALKDHPEKLEAAVSGHIEEMGAALRGKISVMDVLNEPFNNHDYMDLLGNRVMAEWFKKARDVLPGVQLNVNDFLIIANGGRWAEKIDFYDRLAGDLLQKGAPLDAIGFQCHFRHEFLTEPDRIKELCDRFARHGLSLCCSEFDLNIADEPLQADYTRDFMTAWFAHPGTTEFVQWGFWQGSHWLPYAGLYDVDWREKANLLAYRDLVFNRWWTRRAEAVSGADGKICLRGFLGNYRVTVQKDGKETVHEKADFRKTGCELNILL